MVRADLGASGVAFSLDTESGFKDAIVINGAYGLGELVVQGTISPDEFIVFKPALQKGYEAIIEKKLGAKEQKMVYGDEPGERVAVVSTSPYEKNHFCLEDPHGTPTQQMGNGYRKVLFRSSPTLVPHGCGMGSRWHYPSIVHCTGPARDHSLPPQGRRLY